MAEQKDAYTRLIDDYVDAYAEFIGFPSDILYKQMRFDDELLDRAEGMNEYRQLRKDNMHKGPIGDYLYELGQEGWEDSIRTIESEFAKNRQKAIETTNVSRKANGGIVSLNQMTRPIGYR